VPTYSYACTSCDHRFDVQQAFTDEPLTSCPECSARLRKLFGNVGVAFKGSGFYRTDARADSASRHRSSTGAGYGKPEPAATSSSGSTDGSSSTGSGDRAAKPATEKVAPASAPAAAG
jgi:putative FmdB family regulatory protein